MARLAIAGLVLALASLSSLRPALAEQGPDCEDPDTVACIPASGPAQSVPQPATAARGTLQPVAAAPAPAAPAAAAPAPYPLCPPPYSQPPVPAPAAAAGSAAARPAYPCFNDIYATINRANLAYARAMRSLDGAPLRAYWGQDALQQLLAQIAALQAAGSYRTLRLWSIQVLDQAIYTGYAWVHTTEHWTAATWSLDGLQYDASDAWYDNEYYLYRAGGRWVIGTDIVN